MKDALVTVFERGDQLILLPSGRSPGGLRLPVEPVCVLPLANAQDLAASLGKTLSVSEEAKVPKPDWKTFRPPHFDAVGVKNARQFFKGVRTCTVHRHAEKGFVITPMKIADADNLVPDTDAALVLGEAALDLVAEAVRKALEAAELHP